MDLVRIIKQHISDLRDLTSEKDSHPHTMGRVLERLVILSQVVEELEMPRLTQGQGEEGPPLTSSRDDDIIRHCLEYALENDFVLGEAFTKEEIRKLLEDFGD